MTSYVPPEGQSVTELFAQVPPIATHNSPAEAKAYAAGGIRTAAAMLQQYLARKPNITAEQQGTLSEMAGQLKAMVPDGAPQPDGVLVKKGPIFKAWYYALSVLQMQNDGMETGLTREQAVQLTKIARELELQFLPQMTEDQVVLH